MHVCMYVCSSIQSQYALIMDILNNLLLRKQPKKKVQLFQILEVATTPL